MKADELTQMTEAELNQKLAESKTDLFNLRFQHAAGQLENPKRLNEVRKNIARIFTVMKQRELQEAGKGGSE